MSFAEVIEDLTVQADSISYSEDGTSIEAFGSVEAISGDIKIISNHIIYNLSSREIIAQEGFEMMLKAGFKLRGEYIDYNLRTKSGVTRNVKITYKTSVFTGNIANVDEEKVELIGASFNACGLDPPHYHVSSYTTTVYPADGWVIGYFGYLWVDGVPIVPVPAYIFDLSVYGLGRKSETRDVLSVPEFGSNDEDGSYVIYKVPWIASRKLNGRVVLNYTQRGGMGEGIEGNYAMNDNNDIFFRAYYDPRYDYFGGLTHSYYFGPELGGQVQNIYTFLRIKSKLLFELKTNISNRERINYQLVSMLPNMTLKLNEIPAFFPNFKFGGEVSYGKITEVTEESTSYTSDRGNLSSQGYFDIPITKTDDLQVGLIYNQTWYGGKDNWTRLSQNVKYSHRFEQGADSYLSHLHYLNFTGGSPFLYEQYLTIPSDEIGFGLGYNFGIQRISFDYSYYVPDWQPKDLDYGLSLGFHCYSVDMKYRATRRELLVGVGLITW